MIVDVPALGKMLPSIPKDASGVKLQQKKVFLGVLAGME